MSQPTRGRQAQSARESADRAELRAAGAFFTPPPVVRYIVRRTLDPLLTTAHPDHPLRILEPACGPGVFLIETYRYLLEWHLRWYTDAGAEVFAQGPHARLIRCTPFAAWRLTVAERRRILLASIYGVDIHADSVAAASRALAELAADGEADQVAELQLALAERVICGDALLDVRDGQFDAVLGNPPYVNIRVLTKSTDAANKSRLHKRFRCARGGYDLYVLFIERAFEWLRPGGNCGFIVPNKIAAAEYARPCRDLLLNETCLQEIVDLSPFPVFAQIGVYPYILVWRKQPPPAEHTFLVRLPAQLDELEDSRRGPSLPAIPQTVRVASGGRSLVPEPEAAAGESAIPARVVPASSLSHSVRQAALSPTTGLQIHGFLDVESRVRTRPLAELAELHSGSTGFTAAEVAAHLREAGDAPAGPGFQFIVSRNIDRYEIRLGRVRFMKRRFERPLLDPDAPFLTDRKRALYAAPKILLAGMIRRLEAAWDGIGLALGVQVYAVVPRELDPRYLLALLNSGLMSYLFRLRFRAKRLAGGFLALNKGQLACLPIRIVRPEEAEDCQRVLRLIDLVDQLQSETGAAGAEQPSHAKQALLAERAALDAELDDLVNQLYRVSAAEAVQIAESLGLDYPSGKPDASCCRDDGSSS